MEQVVENVRIGLRGTPARSRAADLALIDQVRAGVRSRAPWSTAPRAATACPARRASTIPMILLCVNDAALFDDPAPERAGYRMEVGAGHTAPLTACEECGQCEEACPQMIKIPEELKKAAALLE